MENKIDLSIIIVNFNTKDLLEACLKSVFSSQGKFYFEVIVVDNGSVDDSAKMVADKFPKVKLIKSQNNLGFSTANNLAIKKAKPSSFILLLNPDTVVPKTSLKKMITFMEQNSKAGAATCRVEMTNGCLDQACHRGFPTAWNAFCYFSGLEKLFPKSRFFSGYSLGYLPLNKTHQIDSACGAFLMIRRQAGDEVNWLDQDYFWYGEDIDFCYRLKQNGWQIFFVADIKITHYKGMASGIKSHSQKISSAKKETRIKAAKASIQVMHIFFNKHYRDKYPKVIYWLVILGIIILEKIRLLKLKFS